MIYFTADTHFGSERIFKYSLRPFSTVKQTDKKLIKNWNKTVKNSDFVYHIGDFGNYDVVKRLKGNIILIMGNYEVNDQKRENKTFEQFKNSLIEKGFYDVINEEGIKLIIEEISKTPIHLTHKPTNCDPNCFNLFGHIHALAKIKDFGLNVGVDCNNFNVVSTKTIKFFKNAQDEGAFTDDVYCQKRDLKSN